MNEEKSRSSQQEKFNLRLLAPPPLPSPKLRLPVYRSSNAADLPRVRRAARRAPQPPPPRFSCRLASSRVPAGPGVGPRRVVHTGTSTPDASCLTPRSASGPLQHPLAESPLPSLLSPAATYSTVAPTPDSEPVSPSSPGRRRAHIRSSVPQDSKMMAGRGCRIRSCSA